MRTFAEIGRDTAQWLKRFIRETRGNTAMMFGLTTVTVIMASGAGIDMARAIAAKSRLSEALDAAALAVGTTSGLTQTQLQALAQKYFDANYPSNAVGSHNPVVVTTDGQTMNLSVTGSVPTTLLAIVNINSLGLTVTNQVVKAVTKLRVALVLDNTGSMAETDTTGTSKISALKSASHQLLTQLQNAAVNAGDVQVSLIPFSLDVKSGTANSGASWIDWSDFDAAPSGGTPSTSIGPGDTCPYSNTSNGFKCTSGPTNDANCNVGNNNTCVGNIPSTGTYKGDICPSAHNANASNGRGGHFYNGCYDSVPTKTSTLTQTATTPITDKQSCSQTGSGTITCTNNSGYPQNGTTTNSSNTVVTTGYTGDSVNTNSNTVTNSTTDGTKNCSGSGSNRRCTWTRTIAQTQTANTITATGLGPYNHTWHANAHSTWGGCVMDRTQSYDVNNTTPGSGSGFPAENTAYCPGGTLTALSYDWTSLSSAVDAMAANGSTNQTIGFSWGWQALTQGVPLSAPASDNYTTQVIIILSDGLNTQDRWYGDGSNQSSSVDAREALACTNAKAAGVIVYTLFVDLGGTSGNSAPLQNCASDSSKYFDLTTSGQIVTAFNQIGTELANLHLSE